MAKYYYYPGWWEGGPSLHNFVNIEKWNALPTAYKSIIKTASALANETMQARYDAYNPPALRQLIAGGAELRPFSQSIMEACLKAANEVYAETSAKNADFKKVYDSMRPSAAMNICGGRWPSTPTTTSWSARARAADPRLSDMQDGPDVRRAVLLLGRIESSAGRRSSGGRSSWGRFEI